MKKIHWFFAVLSVAGFWGWVALRRPASPSDALPAVQYTALIPHLANPAAGQDLATVARSWSGVTASTFNDQSGLLVLAHTQAVDKNALLERVGKYTQTPAELKVFEASAGPQCPVPFELIQQIPAILLGLSLFSTAVFLLLSYLPGRRSASA